MLIPILMRFVKKPAIDFEGPGASPLGGDVTL